MRCGTESNRGKRPSGRIQPSGEAPSFNTFRRPKYLFSGLTKCGECGGGYIMYWRERLACFNARSRGTCMNRLTISRQEVEERVLRALREKLMQKDLFEEFCREYTREINRLRMSQRSGLSRSRHELARVERELRQLVQAIKQGVSGPTVKDELLSLEAQQVELKQQLQAPEPQPLLHPSMADLYRTKVRSGRRRTKRFAGSSTPSRWSRTGTNSESLSKVIWREC
jgi:site-specific DNA recombinase